MIDINGCFIYWNLEENDPTVHIQCVNCHEINKLGVFWPADYGFVSDLVCCECGNTIQQKTKT